MAYKPRGPHVALTGSALEALRAALPLLPQLPPTTTWIRCERAEAVALWAHEHGVVHPSLDALDRALADTSGASGFPLESLLTVWAHVPLSRYVCSGGCDAPDAVRQRPGWVDPMTYRGVAA